MVEKKKRGRPPLDLRSIAIGTKLWKVTTKGDVITLDGSAKVTKVELVGAKKDKLQFTVFAGGKESTSEDLKGFCRTKTELLAHLREVIKE